MEGARGMGPKNSTIPRSCESPREAGGPALTETTAWTMVGLTPQHSEARLQVLGWRSPGVCHAGTMGHVSRGDCRERLTE